MKIDRTLTEKVKSVLDELPAPAEPLFSPAVLEAMALADKYSDIKPVEFTLPLDALAGMAPFACGRNSGR